MDEMDNSFIELFEKIYKRNHKVLDVGCGNGELIESLKHNYGAKIVGIDPYPILNMKEERQECYELKGEEINQLDQIFDIIYTIKTLHHLNKPNLFLKNSKKVLNNKGHIIIVDWKEGVNNGLNEEYFNLDEVMLKLKEQGYKIIQGKRKDRYWSILAQIK